MRDYMDAIRKPQKDDIRRQKNNNLTEDEPAAIIQLAINGCTSQ
jgi:hypothetical protein